MPSDVQRGLLLRAGTDARARPATARRARRRGGWRSLRLWHRWLGLGVALVMVLAALSGVLLVYKKPLVRALVTPGAELPAAMDVAQLATQLMGLAQRVPDLNRYRIKAPNADEPYWTLVAADGETQLLAVATLAPYAHNLWLLDGLAWLRQLHVALLAGGAGELLLLVAGVIGLLLTGTGLWLWWPARRSWRWHTVLPRPVHWARAVHYHRDSGALASLVLLLVLLTGALMLWQKLVAPLLPPVAVTAVPEPVARDPSPAQFLRLAAARVPGGWPSYIRLGNPDDPLASVRFRLPGEWHPNGRTTVTLDRSSGQLSVSERSDQSAPARRLLNQLYPLHSGYGMPAAYLLLVFASGLALAWLCITGLVSYVRRARQST